MTFYTWSVLLKSMSNQELINYIKEALSKGSTKLQITPALLNSGWQQTDIDLAFSSLDNPGLLVPPPPLPKHIADSDSNTSMWDSFEHILLFISLYVMTTAIALVLNYFVDKLIPTPTTVNLYSINDTFSRTIVNGYLAALIVSTPIFSFLFLKIQKRTFTNPQIRALKARKILIYITLVGTFIIMLSQIISTVYSLLNGNISLNFLCHFLVTIGVSGIIFVYYTLQVKGDRKLNG